jgi:hypothetical protein
MAESTPSNGTPIQERFNPAATRSTPEQIEAVTKITAAVVELGHLIEFLAPMGRNKSLAFTSLEDVQMRANRAIFASGPSA